MWFHIEVLTASSKPTMMAAAAMGACLYHMETTLPPSIFLKDKKFLNEISHNNQQSSNTFHSTCHYIETNIANSMVNATPNNHHEQQSPVEPVNLAVIHHDIKCTTAQWNLFFDNFLQMH